jgi:maleate cis-trans isomerase
MSPADRSTGAPRRLGWIKPDDGVRRDGRLLPYECLDLDRRLPGFGIAGLEVRVALSRAEALHTPEDLLATGAPERLLPPARELAAAGCDAVLWVCTSGSFVGGLAWARAQAAALGAAVGLPASSTSLALVAALERLGAGEVDLLSPYPEALTLRLRTFLAEAGIEVGASRTLGCPTGSDSHALDVLAEAQALAASTPGRRVPLLIPDAAINTLDRVEALERALERPVVTANQASLWQGLALVGLPATAHGLGRLLERAPGDPPAAA